VSTSQPVWERARILTDRLTVADCPHGWCIELQNWPHDTLTLSRVQRGQRVFHAVSSELMEGDEVISEGAKRWHIEDRLRSKSSAREISF
jgi:hypothetical protein